MVVLSPAAILSIISTTATLQPRAARYSAVSQPTMPPPITATVPYTCCSPASTFQASATFTLSMPGMRGAALCAPTALITASKPASFSSCAVGACARHRCTPALQTAWIRSCAARRISSLRGGTQAMFSWPPRAVVFSNRVTSWPRRAATRAASRPAGPPPRTATFFFCAAGWMLRLFS